VELVRPLQRATQYRRPNREKDNGGTFLLCIMLPERTTLDRGARRESKKKKPVWEQRKHQKIRVGFLRIPWLQALGFLC
jgi:hypothetical protein